VRRLTKSETGRQRGRARLAVNEEERDWPSTSRSLFEAGLIGEIGFNIHPVLLGAGVPLFHPMSRPINLELRECRAFKNGRVHVTYQIKHEAGRGT